MIGEFTKGMINSSIEQLFACRLSAGLLLDVEQKGLTSQSLYFDG